MRSAPHYTYTQQKYCRCCFELHFTFFFSQVFRHERRQCSLQGKVPRLLPAQLKGHVSQGCDFRKQPVRGRAVGLFVKRKITATVFARFSFLLLPHRSNSCSNLAYAIPEGGPPPGIAQSSRYNMRRQSTTEEILIARGFRRESTTEDIMRCRNFRRQSQVVTSSHFHCHICKLTKGKYEIYMFRKFRSAFVIQAAGIMKKMKGGEG